jgi:hypothetical protein
MDTEEYKKLRSDITEDLNARYFLIRRDRVLAFAAACLAFGLALVIGTPIAAYRFAKSALTDEAVARARSTVLDSERQATNTLARIVRSDERLTSLEQQAVLRGQTISLEAKTAEGRFLRHASFACFVDGPAATGPGRTFFSSDAHFTVRDAVR